MSELHLTDRQTKKFPSRGDTDFLSPEENAFVQRILSRPESFPQAFWSALIQKLALDGLLMPQSQVQGLTRLNNQVGETIDQIAVIGTTYTNEPGGFAQTGFNGQQLVSDPTATVPAGTYFCILTAQASWAAGGTNALMRLNNGAAVNPFGSVGRVNGVDQPGESTSLMSIGSVTVSAASNVINGWFSQEGNGAINYEQRFLIAMRTS